MQLILTFIITIILLWLQQIDMIHGFPIYKKIPSMKERSHDKCEPYEVSIYKVESCRLSCQIIFHIGHIHYYEEPRLLTSIKPDGTFCTPIEGSGGDGDTYYNINDDISKIKTDNIKRLQYGTCHAGICYPNKIHNNNNHNNNNNNNIINGGHNQVSNHPDKNIHTGNNDHQSHLSSSSSITIPTSSSKSHYSSKPSNT